MAIAPSLLRLRYGNVSLGAAFLNVTWEMYHPATATIVESGMVTVPLSKPSAISEAWDDALVAVTSQTAAVLDKHKPLSAIGGYSTFDADLILDRWLSDPVAGTLVHPICGTFSGVSYVTLVDLVNAILARVLGPTTWWWAEATATAGAARVKCLAVPNATGYNIYDGSAMIRNVASATAWVNLTGLSSGPHTLRIAALKDSQVGALSFPLTVEVL